MIQFSKILKCQLLWINWDYLHTLSYIFWAEGHRRVWLYWWLFWKDFTFLRTPGPSIWRWASGFHKPRGCMSPGWLHRIQPSYQETQEQNKALPPSRACFAVPAGRAGVTAGADGKHRDTVGVCYFTTHRCLDLIMLSTD